MLRTAFILLITIHALIHLMGFAKAFGLAEFEQLSQPISRARGLWWLPAAVLILLSMVLFTVKQSWWWLPALIGAALSQVLIIQYWQDAKWGTIANVVLLLVALVGWGQWQFERSVQNDLNDFWSADEQERKTIDQPGFSNLPNQVQQWLHYAGISEQGGSDQVHIRQLGKMRTSPDGGWMDFTAEQWFDVTNPAFLWYAEVGGKSFMQLRGKDRLLDGRGHMLIKLFGLLPIVDAQGTEIDQGTLVRYLSEMIWFPAAALEDYLQWEALDEQRVRATLRVGEQSVNGIFFFNSSGQVIAFEADRYYQRDGKSSLETWHIDIDENSWQTFRGIKIPTKAGVSWKLADGDFTWLELEIVDLD